MPYIEAPPAGTELLTVNQAKARIRVSRRTIYNWLYPDRLRYTRTAGGSLRIIAESLFQPAATAKVPGWNLGSVMSPTVPAGEMAPVRSIPVKSRASQVA